MTQWKLKWDFEKSLDLPQFWIDRVRIKRKLPVFVFTVFQIETRYFWGVFVGVCLSETAFGNLVWFFALIVVEGGIQAPPDGTLMILYGDMNR